MPGAFPDPERRLGLRSRLSFPKEFLRVALTAILTLILQHLWQRLLKRRLLLNDRLRWDSRVDLDNVQACLLTTVNLSKCGRIEKRTVMSKKLTDIFPNEHVRNLVLEAAEKTTAENPFVCSHLKMEDRWNVLVAAGNHLSSIFGPYHLFSNQVATYESHWYVFAIVGSRSGGSGRFFITPQHPLKQKHDVGVMRIRLVLVNEQELRSICSGDIAETQDMFSERHIGRWAVMKRFAHIFEKQLAQVTRKNTMTDDSFDVRTQSWGNHLCGTVAPPRRSASSEAPDSGAVGSRFCVPLKRTKPDETVQAKEEDDPDCNNFLRIHVPIPLLKEAKLKGPQDVVLYE